MSKLEAKFSALLKNISQRETEMNQYLNEVVVAQNHGGVVMMTLLQMLSEKGLLNKEEIEERIEQNQKLALDEDGNCVIALTSLLDRGEQTNGDGAG